MKSERFIFILLIVLVGLLVNQRLRIHSEFNSRYTDDDQTVQWLAARDISKGRIQTPFFYGQHYNNMLVAWLAAPLVYFGYEVQKAIPLMANFVGALPLLFISVIFFRRQQFIALALIVAFWLAMPIEYHLILSMARGFAGGLVFMTFGLMLLCSTNYMLQNIGVFCIGISPILNVNVLIVLLPLLAGWLAIHLDRRKIVGVLPAIISILSIYVLSNRYKTIHAEEVVHAMWSMELNVDYLTSGLKQIPERFAYLFPFLQSGTFLFIPVLIITILFYRFSKHRSVWIWVLTGTLIVIASPILNKAADGTSNLFFPYGRLYLGYPVLIMLALGYGLNRIELSKKFVMLVFCSVGVIGHVWSMKRLDAAIKKGVGENTGHVEVTEIHQLCQRCEVLEALRKSSEAGLVVFYNKAAKFNYGCTALIDSFNSVHPGYDRRFWKMEEVMNTPFHKILWLDWNLNLENLIKEKSGEFKRLEGVSFPAYLHTGNTQSLGEIYRTNNLDLPQYWKEDARTQTRN